MIMQCEYLHILYQPILIDFSLPWPDIFISNASLSSILHRWGEVDFLLRRQVRNEDDIAYTIASAEAGLLFIEQVQ